MRLLLFSQCFQKLSAAEAAESVCMWVKRNTMERGIKHLSNEQTNKLTDPLPYLFHYRQEVLGTNI